MQSQGPGTSVPSSSAVSQLPLANGNGYQEIQHPVHYKPTGGEGYNIPCPGILLTFHSPVSRYFQSYRCPRSADRTTKRSESLS